MRLVSSLWKVLIDGCHCDVPLMAHGKNNSTALGVPSFRRYFYDISKDLQEIVDFSVFRSGGIWGGHVSGPTPESRTLVRRC